MLFFSQFSYFNVTDFSKKFGYLDSFEANKQTELTFSSLSTELNVLYLTGLQLFKNSYCNIINLINTAYISVNAHVQMCDVAQFFQKPDNSLTEI
jgi:hypothetical protein